MTDVLLMQVPVTNENQRKNIKNNYLKQNKKTLSHEIPIIKNRCSYFMSYF